MVSTMAVIRALFWFRRRPETRGGDWIALRQYIEALRAEGVEGTVSDDPTHDPPPYDVIHLYNLCDPYLTAEYSMAAAHTSKPLAMTPIYWSHAQWLAARAVATPATRPEFFLGERSPAAWETVRYVQTREQELFMQVHRIAAQRATLVFPLSQMEGEMLTRDFGVSPNAQYVTPNGVDPRFLHGNAARFVQAFGFKDFVFSAARIEERKNTIGLIRAWRGEKIPLVLAGRAPDERYLALCKQEADSNMHFVGLLNPEQVADAHAAARVHVLASWWEEMGLAALEAGLAGCNVVMTQNGPGREYFGDACFACDPAEPHSIRTAIHAAMNAPRNPDLPQRLSEHFTWARAAQVTRAAYEKVLEGGGAHSAAIDENALREITGRLAEMVYLKQEAFVELETHARKNEAWARELEVLVQRKNGAGALARVEKWFKRG